MLHVTLAAYETSSRNIPGLARSLEIRLPCLYVLPQALMH